MKVKVVEHNPNAVSFSERSLQLGIFEYAPVPVVGDTTCIGSYLYLVRQRCIYPSGDLRFDVPVVLIVGRLDDNLSLSEEDSSSL